MKNSQKFSNSPALLSQKPPFFNPAAPQIFQLQFSRPKIPKSFLHHSSSSPLILPLLRSFLSDPSSPILRCRFLLLLSSAANPSSHLLRCRSFLSFPQTPILPLVSSDADSSSSPPTPLILTTTMSNTAREHTLLSTEIVNRGVESTGPDAHGPADRIGAEIE